MFLQPEQGFHGQQIGPLQQRLHRANFLSLRWFGILNDKRISPGRFVVLDGLRQPSNRAATVDVAALLGTQLPVARPVYRHAAKQPYLLAQVISGLVAWSFFAFFNVFLAIFFSLA